MIYAQSPILIHNITIPRGTTAKTVQQHCLQPVCKQIAWHRCRVMCTCPARGIAYYPTLPSPTRHSANNITPIVRTPEAPQHTMRLIRSQTRAGNFSIFQRHPLDHLQLLFFKAGVTPLPETSVANINQTTPSLLASLRVSGKRGEWVV